jgi:hypothetical protein
MASEDSGSYRDDATPRTTASEETLGDGDEYSERPQADALSFLRIDDEHDEAGPWPNKRTLADAIRQRIPPRLQRVGVAVAKWTKGPQPPRPWRITPYFADIQTAPLHLLDRYFPRRKQKIGLLIIFYVVWLFTFSLVLHKSAFASEVGDYGSPVNIGCGSRFWSVLLH